jgi:hypothetical protein
MTVVGDDDAPATPGWRNVPAMPETPKRARIPTATSRGFLDR